MQVTEHVHAIKIPFSLTSDSGMLIERFVYAYLIYGREVCLVDCGVASSEKIIFDYMKKTGRDPQEISLIVQTHSHADHIGATPVIKELTGCEVAAHSDALEWIEDPDVQFRERPIPNFDTLSGGPVKVDRVLEDGDVIDLGEGMAIRVIHTPGHSNGSISLVLSPDHVLFSGDSIPLPGDIPIYDNVAEVISSLRKLRETGGVKLLLSSWDDPVKGDDVYKAIDEGIDYVKRVHEAVLGFSSVSWEKVLEEIGLEGVPVNPLVVRTFEAHLKEDVDIS
ncbi:Glyoxylase, beta-lactamase superfamily II [Methanococcoides vulcani]|uniref:Glyoxylase, beta-lactamase superfamily II n=1 Tax=Methanococcoides vulcani TaxID=1353158 RepID=A0A1I0A9H6_9EURY|nr:MBL fold metallo-hydrolase [Methanococcoides vulcani]SES90805.1 Glyoxylase, beta-lactamase superfamily II [Methanococcoides vulcani]